MAMAFLSKNIQPANSPLADASGFPCSCTNSSASSSAFAVKTSSTLCIALLRSETAVDCHVRNAIAAAFTACTATSSCACGALAKGAPVEGLKTSYVSSDATNWPSTSILKPDIMLDVSSRKGLCCLLIPLRAVRALVRVPTTDVIGWAFCIGESGRSLHVAWIIIHVRVEVV